MRKDQYIIKCAYQKPFIPQKLTHNKIKSTKLEESVTMDEKGKFTTTGTSLINPKVCSAIADNYCKLKDESFGKFHSDIWNVLFDYDNLRKKALKDYPAY